MESISQKVAQRIKNKGRGKIFFPRDFYDLGSETAVRKALDRLENLKEIKRLARGIYVKPKVNKLLNKEVAVSVEEISIAIAKRDGAKILPSRNMALNALGLSTQVPTKVVVLTSGSGRKLRVGKNEIQYKKTCPRMMAMKGPISRLVVLGLKEIGEKNVGENEIRILQERLKVELKDNILHDAALAPKWIRNILKKLADERN